MQELTGNGKLSQELVGVGSLKPLFQIRPWKLLADDGGNIKGLVLVKDALKSEWLFVGLGALDGHGLANRPRSLDSGSRHVRAVLLCELLMIEGFAFSEDVWKRKGTDMHDF